MNRDQKIQELRKEADTMLEKIKSSAQVEAEFVEEYGRKELEIRNLMLEAEQERMDSFNHPTTEMYANCYQWTDSQPFEIVEAKNDKLLVIRAMDAVIDPEYKPQFIAGGFAGHVPNNYEQKWIYSKNTQRPTIKIRKHSDGIWRDKHGGTYRISDKPCKFHDYNF